MPNTRNYLRSFAGGEVSPEMFGRIDDIRYQTGAALMRNFIAKPQGPARNRPGFALVREVKDSTKKTRLIPFTFSVDQTYVIELGAGYFRFHTDGATLQFPDYPEFFAADAPTPGELAITGSNASNDLLLSSGATPHGLSNDDPVFIWAGTYPSPTVIHYVLEATSTTFKVATSVGGPAVLYTPQLPAKVSFLYYEGDNVIYNGSIYRKNSNQFGGSPYWNSSGPTPDTVPFYWDNMGVPGAYEVANTYTESELFDINYVQSNDVLTLVHPNHPPAELRRYGVDDWQLETISFVAPLAAPGGITGTPFYGKRHRIAHFHVTTGSAGNTVDKPPHFFREVIDGGVAGGVRAKWPYSVGDSIFVDETRDDLSPSNIIIEKGHYQVHSIDNSVNQPYITLSSVDDDDPWIIPGSPANGSTESGTGATQYSDDIEGASNKYVVTAIGVGDIAESPPSTSVTVQNNLLATSATNKIEWNLVSGAQRYHIYKEQNGLYGYIGQAVFDPVASPKPFFIDDNIAPDMGISPPTYDDTLTSAGNYPASVAYFEQRRVFAGTDNEPQNIWMTKSGTESDFSYQIPTRDNDRISFQIASREANRVRHIVPLTELLLLTNSAEWRVTSVNSDAITPSSIAVRPQSYIGASGVRPTVVNNSLVYCAARGGHVRELGYNDSVRGFVTNDVSLRAAHLFDNLTISDQAYQKSPLPIVWFVSSNGKLLGLTYIPEQQIGAWHQHDTLDGTFESCCVVSEGDEDRLYVVVKRRHKEVEGVVEYRRYVERMAVWKFDTIADSFFVDSGLSFDGTNTTAAQMKVTGGTLWDPSEELTLNADTPQFVTGPSSTDIGDVVELDAADGQIYRLTIVSVTSDVVAKVRVDKTLPAALRDTFTAAWAFCRNTFTGLGHLNGYTVSILADGARHNQLVVTTGTVTLSRAARKVHIGIPIEADLQTLPMTLQIDGFGQGRHKNVNRVWLRVFRSSGVLAGPDESSLVPYKQRTTEPYGTPPRLMSEQIEVVLHPSWDEDGQVYIRQADPLPLTIAGLTIEVALGG